MQLLSWVVGLQLVFHGVLALENDAVRQMSKRLEQHYQRHLFTSHDMWSRFMMRSIIIIIIIVVIQAARADETILLPLPCSAGMAFCMKDLGMRPRTRNGDYDLAMLHTRLGARHCHESHAASTPASILNWQPSHSYFASPKFRHRIPMHRHPGRYLIVVIRR